MEITLIGLIFIPIALILFAFNSKYLFALLVFFSPFTATSVINVYSVSFGLQLSMFIGAIFTLKMFLEVIKKRQQLLLSKIHLLLIGALLLFVIMLMPGFIVNTVNGDISFFNFTQFIYLLSGIFITLSVTLFLLFNKDYVLKSLNIYIYSSVFVAGWGIYQLITIYTGLPYLDFLFNNSISDAASKFNMVLQGSEQARISSVAVEPSFLARTSSVALSLIIFYYLVNEYVKINTFILFALISIFSVLILTVSSSAILGLAVIVFLLAVLKPIKSMPFLFLSSFSIILFLLSNDEYLYSLEMLTTEKMNTQSYYLRMATIEGAWNGFLDSPLFGQGWETNPSQDVFMKLLGNTGIIGTSLFIFIYAYSVISNLKLSKNYNDSRKWIHISIAFSVLTLLVIDTASSLSFVFSFMWVLLGISIFTASYYLPIQANKA